MKHPSFKYEQELWQQGKKFIVGIDEVGRGCFAGPVVVGAVIFTPDSQIPEGIADSKLLSSKKRKQLESDIKNQAEYWAIEEVSVKVINEVGIGKAAQLAFKNVLRKLKQEPDHILIDAFFIEDIDKKNQSPIIGGDNLSISIAAASIIAKVYRDELMAELDVDFPEYGFKQHKGYGTKAHREAIKKYGLCDLHRTSFSLSKFL